jgi:hypothetical protein
LDLSTLHEVLFQQFQDFFRGIGDPVFLWWLLLLLGTLWLFGCPDPLYPVIILAGQAVGVARALKAPHLAVLSTPTTLHHQARSRHQLQAQACLVMLQLKCLHTTQRTSSSQCNTMQCNTLQYNTIQYNTIQYNAIQ